MIKGQRTGLLAPKQAFTALGPELGVQEQRDITLLDLELFLRVAHWHHPSFVAHTENTSQASANSVALLCLPRFQSLMSLRLSVAAMLAKPLSPRKLYQYCSRK